VGYYTRLEQGNGDNVSADVLDAIARALRLTDDEHTYLTQLAKPKRTYRKSRPRPQRMRAGLQYLLDSFDSVPAYVAGSRSDILGWNRLAAALLGDWDTLAPQELNGARLVFLSLTARDLFVDWEMKAAATVSQLRMEAGRCPDDPQLASLVGELSVKSADFRRLWAAHDVREKGHGVTRLRHPLVGSLTLSFETFKLSEDQAQTLVTFHAEPGSSSAESLRLLASWAADSATTIR
jgi:transcriptional regulator with XRE-family HTH domain